MSTVESVPEASAPPGADTVLPRRRVLGLAACVVPWLLAVASVGLAVGFRPWGNVPAYALHEQFYLPDAVVAVLYAPVAGLVLSRSRHPIGWLLGVTAVGFAVAAFALQYALLGVTRPDLPALGLVAHLVTWCWAVGAFGIVLVMPWLLSAEPPTGARSAAAWLGLALALLVSVPRVFLQLPRAPTNPLALPPRPAGWLETTLSHALVPAGVAYALVGIGYLVWRRTHASTEERTGLSWVIAGLLLATVSYGLFDVGIRVGAPLLQLASSGLFAAMVMLPAALLVLVSRHRLWGLDVVVSRATLWGLLTAILVGASVALVWVTGRLLPGGENTSAFVVAIALALAVQPARRWMQTFVDRLVYGRGADAGLLLQRLGAAAHSAGLDDLVDGLRRDLRLGYVEVRSADGGPRERAVAGRPAPSDLRVPLGPADRPTGWLLVAARPSERLDPRTRGTLEQVAGVLGVALGLSRANAELAAARDRLVEVRHEERRLLRRELHDSLGPALAGVGLGLAAIENDAGALTPRNRELLEQLREELSRRADDVRTMAHALLPPALDDGRLEEALHALARRFTDDSFEVRVDADGADGIDTRRQVAVYHVAGEAVLNAYRHSRGRRCTIRVQRRGPEVTVVVDDDGVGLADGTRPGVGLTSMRERATEVGGALRVDGSRGTRVEVTLP